MDDIDKAEEIAVAESVDNSKKINVTQDDLECICDTLYAVQKKLLEQEHIIQTFASKQEAFEAVLVEVKKEVFDTHNISRDIFNNGNILAENVVKIAEERITPTGQKIINQQQATINGLSNELEKAKEKIVALEKQRDEEWKNNQESIQGLQNVITSLEADNNSLNKAFTDAQADWDMKKKHLKKEIEKLEADKNDLNNEKGVLEDKLAGLKSEIKKLEGIKTGLEDKMKLLEEDKEALRKEIYQVSMAKEQMQKALEDEIAVIEKEKGDIKSRLYDVETAKSKLEHDYLSLQDNITCLHNEIQKNKQNHDALIRKAQANIENLDIENDKLIKELSACKESLELHQKEARAGALVYENKLMDLQRERQHLKASLDGAVTELEIKTKTLEQWVSLGKAYEPALKALQKNESFAALVPKLGLVGDSIETLFKFITLVGRNLSFANLVHRQIKFIKKDKVAKEGPDSCLMNEAERQLYILLNNCYKQTYGKDFEVFQYPGGQSLLGIYNRVRFNPDEVENMPEPSKKNLNYSKGVYLPVVYNPDNGNIAILGQVKAGNN